jgi:hypothetical protein
LAPAAKTGGKGRLGFHGQLDFLSHPKAFAAWLRIPMMSISHSDLMPISSERSDAGLSQCETVIDIRQGFLAFS